MTQEVTTAEEFFRLQAIKDGYITEGDSRGLTRWYRDNGMLSPDALEYAERIEVAGLLDSPLARVDCE